MSVGNWSVSQPSSRSPVLASIEPRAPDAAGGLQLVLHRVTGERGVVGFDVQLQVRQQVVLPEEVEAGGGVGIVLMLGRLFRLGLDVELALEADLLGVVDRHVQELGEVVELALHVGVPEILVAFAAAPEDVAGAVEFLGDFEGLLHLRRGVGEDLGVAARGRTVHVARIAEQVGRAPEQLDAGPLLFFLEHLRRRRRGSGSFRRGWRLRARRRDRGRHRTGRRASR